MIDAGAEIKVEVVDGAVARPDGGLGLARAGGVLVGQPAHEDLQTHGRRQVTAVEAHAGLGADRIVGTACRLRAPQDRSGAHARAHRGVGLHHLVLDALEIRLRAAGEARIARVPAVEAFPIELGRQRSVGEDGRVGGIQLGGPDRTDREPVTERLHRLRPPLLLQQQVSKLVPGVRLRRFGFQEFPIGILRLLRLAGLLGQHGGRLRAREAEARQRPAVEVAAAQRRIEIRDRAAEIAGVETRAAALSVNPARRVALGEQPSSFSQRVTFAGGARGGATGATLSTGGLRLRERRLDVLLLIGRKSLTGERGREILARAGGIAQLATNEFHAAPAAPRRPHCGR